MKITLQAALIFLFMISSIKAISNDGSKNKHISDICNKYNTSTTITQKKAYQKLRDNPQDLTKEDLKDIVFALKVSSDSLESDSTIDELMEIIESPYISIPVPENADSDYFYYKKKLSANHELLLKRARTLLSQKGEKVIDKLIMRRKQHNCTNAYLSNMLKILCEMKSLRAKMIIREIINQKREGWYDIHAKQALSYYIKTISMSEAKDLLSLENNEMFVTIIEHFPELAGESIAFNRICNFLNSENIYYRFIANKLLSKLPSDKLTFKRLTAYAESMKTLYSNQNFREKNSLNQLGTDADRLGELYLQNLVNMKDIDSNLRTQINNSKGFARKWLIVASAIRGNSDYKLEIIDILKDQNSVGEICLRIQAARALGIIGNFEEIDILKDISENDPYNYLNRGGAILERNNVTPINISRELMEKLDDEFKVYDPWESAIKHYPVRDAAKQSISVIASKYVNE